MKGKPWTDEEIGYLLDRTAVSAKEMAEILGRTEISIYGMRARLRNGWSKAQADFWTEAEYKLLADQSLSAKQLAKRMPGRTESAILQRRSKLGIKVGSNMLRDPWAIAGRTVIARTCSRCGYLLPGKWFSVTSQRTGLTSICRKCKTQRMYSPTAKAKAYQSLYYKKAQQLTAPLATRRRDEYTESDHKVLADESLTRLGKALVLKRTFAAVSSAVSRNGYKSAHYLADPTRDRWRIDNPNADRIDEITAALKQEFETAGVPFPAWDWDDEDLKETAA